MPCSWKTIRTIHWYSRRAKTHWTPYFSTLQLRSKKAWNIYSIVRDLKGSNPACRGRFDTFQLSNPHLSPYRGGEIDSCITLLFPTLLHSLPLLFPTLLHHIYAGDAWAGLIADQCSTIRQDPSNSHAWRKFTISVSHLWPTGPVAILYLLGKSPPHTGLHTFLPYERWTHPMAHNTSTCEDTD